MIGKRSSGRIEEGTSKEERGRTARRQQPGWQRKVARKLQKAE